MSEVNLELEVKGSELTFCPLEKGHTLEDNARILRVDQAQNGVVVENADGTFTYIPTPDFSGDDHFSYVLVDDNADRFTAYVNLKVFLHQNA